MYDRRSRQPITPQHLITPPADRSRVVRDFLRWDADHSARLLITLRARQKVRLIDTLSEHLIKDNFHFL